MKLLTKRRYIATVFFGLLCLSIAGCAGGASATAGGGNPTPTPGPNPTPTPGPSGESVALSWSPSATNSVVSYNVYRSSASSGPFTKIGNVSGTSFTDQSVQSGQTYFYTVTSVDSDNLESVQAAPVSVTVPSS